MPASVRRMFRASVLIALGVACIGPVLGSCAKKDDAAPLVAPTGTTPPLSQSDFLEQANKVCKVADERIIELTNKGGPVHNGSGDQAQTDLRQLVEQMTPIAENAIATLASLTPPAEDKALVDRGIARIQANLDAAKKDPSGQIDPIGTSDQELYSFGLYACFSKG